MSLIIPSFPPKSRSELIFKLEALKGLTRRVQIDLVDGHFAYPASFPYNVDGTHDSYFTDSHIQSLVKEFEIEIDAMVQESGTEVIPFIENGASRAILHIESMENVQASLDELKRCCDHDKTFDVGLVRIGLALSLSTPIEKLAPYVDQVDFIQCMGIARIGVQGQPFDERVYDQITEIRKRYPGIPVQIDGGITLENAPRLLSLGVSALLVGSHLWHTEDVAGELQKFQVLTEQYGIYE